MVSSLLINTRNGREINLSTLSTLLLPGPQVEAKLLTSGRREVFMLSRMVRKKDREEGKNGWEHNGEA